MLFVLLSKNILILYLKLIIKDSIWTGISFVTFILSANAASIFGTASAGYGFASVLIKFF